MKPGALASHDIEREPLTVSGPSFGHAHVKSGVALTVNGPRSTALRAQATTKG